MINIVVLQDTLNPVSAAERVKVNQNWDAIRRGFSSLQNQIAFLSGGEDVDAIIQRIENAIAMAEIGSQTAIDNVNNNYAERVIEINQALSDLSAALNNATNVTQATEAERLLTAQATTEARAAIDQLTSIVNDLRSLGEYNSSTAYKRNNLVSLDGRTYIALQDNTNQPVTNSSYWALFADRGQDGERGPQGEAGASLNIIGVLPSPESLPPTGNAGDAYTIAGDLYVWSTESNDWVNVGQIKGEKGDKGDAGENGESGYYQLANFQYVINPTTNGQTTIEIPLVSFDVNNHSLTLFRNGVAQDPTTYSIVGRNITLNEAVSDITQTSFFLMITQGVLVQPRDTIDGNVIVDSTIGFSKLNQDVVDAINSSSGMATNVAGLNREVAYLKLRQEATERIEGGTVFADDFNGNRFGFVLDVTNSSNIKTSNGRLNMIGETLTQFTANNELVINQNQNTANNGGRKIAINSNGIFATTRIGLTGVRLYKRNEVSGAWDVINSGITSTLINDVNIVAMGEDLLLGFIGNNSLGARRYSSDGTELSRSSIDTGQTAINTISFYEDIATGIIHAVWSGRNSALNTSNNLRYSSSTDKGATWSTPEQLTSYNAGSVNATSPTLVANNDEISISFIYQSSSSTFEVRAINKIGSGSWSIPTLAENLIYNGNGVTQSMPTSTLDNNGTIHTVWHGGNASAPTTTIVKYSRSTQNGINWSTPVDLTVGQKPTVSIDKNDKITITYENAGSIYYMVSIDGGITFNAPTLIGNGTDPSSLQSFDIVNTVAPSVYTANNTVIFNGDWQSVSESQVNNATVVYNIPSTDYVGLFIQKTGNLELIANINGLNVDVELEENEYKIENSLDSKAPLTLSLSLSRPNNSGGNDDALTRILGGRS